MKIEIVNWWNAKVYSHKTNLNPEETIEKRGRICICEILINGKVVGTVVWDGKELSVSKELVEPSER